MLYYAEANSRLPLTMGPCFEEKYYMVNASVLIQVLNMCTCQVGRGVKRDAMNFTYERVGAVEGKDPYTMRAPENKRAWHLYREEGAVRFTSSTRPTEKHAPLG
ncbi:hypothetical protein KQX54_006454 [Cotesia glomerata]|uniref:Uncharacterized protein n=1 Tax=Cotesia glomerata TaxID=32391 RepID=A0AAV7IV10_COTGL|nr:hypothetical protein KQX54_006454 [Cotesia glomerata]